MPWIQALGALISGLLMPWIYRALGALGIGAVTYVGVKPLLDNVLEEVQGLIGGSSEMVLQFIAVCRLDQCITVIFSAMVIRLTFAGMTAAGGLKKMTWKLPA